MITSRMTRRPPHIAGSLVSLFWLIAIGLMVFLGVYLSETLRNIAYVNAAVKQAERFTHFAEVLGSDDVLVPGADFPKLLKDRNIKFDNTAPWSTPLSFMIDNDGLIISYSTYGYFCRAMTNYFVSSYSSTWVEGQFVTDDSSVSCESSPSVAARIWDRKARGMPSVSP